MSAKPPPRRPKAREAAVEEEDDEDEEQTSPEQPEDEGSQKNLADSGATNVTLNIKHLPAQRRDEATKASMILASGEIYAYLLMDEVFAPEVKTSLCPLLRLTKKSDIVIEWTKDQCLSGLQGTPLMRLTVRKGLHYLTEVQFAMIRRALRDPREGVTDVNKLTY
eukprot:5764235-Amphidinium_carterae.2